MGTKLNTCCNRFTNITLADISYLLKDWPINSKRYLNRQLTIITSDFFALEVNMISL